MSEQIYETVKKENGHGYKTVSFDLDPTTPYQSLVLALQANQVQGWRMKLSHQKSQVMECLVTITPELARKLLHEHNGRNRAINPTKVKKLQNTFREGRWNPDQPDSTIIFGKDAQLKNGQHRLSGCVAEGLSFVTKVEIGHEDNILLYMDQTEPRTEAQQAHILGRSKEEKRDYASAKQMWKLENQSRDFPFERGGKVYELIDSYFPKNIWGIVPPKVFRTKKDILVFPIRATLLYLAIHWPEEVREFFRQIHDTEFKIDTGSYQLYHYINQSNKVSKDKVSYDGRMSMVRLTFKAFLHFLDNKPIKRLADSSFSHEVLLKRMNPMWEPVKGGIFDREMIKKARGRLQAKAKRAGVMIEDEDGDDMEDSES